MYLFNDNINIIKMDIFNLYKINEDLSLNIKEFDNNYKNIIKQNELKRKKVLNSKDVRKKISIQEKKTKIDNLKMNSKKIYAINIKIK